MSQKELLYVEDAIKHEKSIISILEESINQLENKDLMQCLKNDLKIHTKQQKDLLNLLEDNLNE